MNSPEYLISAAGGNITAIQVIDNPQTGEWYAVNGKNLGDRYEKLGAEQSGFLVKSTNHFHMAGGEFCGNATRAAAVLFSKLCNSPDVKYTVSGYNGTVNSHVDQNDLQDVFFVESIFSDMPIDAKEVIANGNRAVLVDLGGIVHVVIQDEMPKNFEDVHRRVVADLDLSKRDAVGVVWYTRNGSNVLIHPVVWVRSIDSFFYETSCGSGSIAVAKVTGLQEIYQVSGEAIHVVITGKSISLKSRMEVINNGGSSSSDLL